MWKAASSLRHISSCHPLLRARSHSGISRLLPKFAALTQPRQSMVPPFAAQAGWTNGTHWMASKMHSPNRLMAMPICYSVPCNVTKRDCMPTTSDEGQNNKSFVVRRANSLDDLQWVIKRATEEGFTQREREAECYFAAGLTPHFFIGELNGERITCMCAVKHERNCFYCGLVNVHTSYRGHGYGQKIWDAAVDSLGDQWTMYGASAKHIRDAHTYMNCPTMPGWISRRYAFDASFACEGLANSQFPSSLAQILPASQANFEKLFAYSADMLGTSQVCKALLAAWLSHTQESSWVAIGNTGEVVGYLIMSRTTRFPEDGYYIAPFYADSAPIARSLLKVAANFAARHDPGHIFLDIAVHLNPEGASILENELGAKELFDMVFSGVNKGIPSKPQYKVFGAASLAVM